MRQVRQSTADLLVVSLGSAFDMAEYPQLCAHLRAMVTPSWISWRARMGGMLRAE